MKKLKNNDSNVFKEVLPLYWALKISGMLPLSFNNKGFLITKTADKVVPVIAVILIGIVASVVYVRALNKLSRVDVVAIGWYIW